MVDPTRIGPSDVVSQLNLPRNCELKTTCLPLRSLLLAGSLQSQLIS